MSTDPVGVEEWPTVVEEAAKVYLEFIDGGWQIAGSAVDGYALDSAYEGSDCDSHYGYDRDDAAHNARHAEADAVELPNAFELLVLLADRLGYALVQS